MFWYNAVWPFRSGPSSGHAMLTCSCVQCYRIHLASNLVPDL